MSDEPNTELTIGQKIYDAVAKVSESVLSMNYTDANTDAIKTVTHNTHQELSGSQDTDFTTVDATILKHTENYYEDNPKEGVRETHDLSANNASDAPEADKKE